MSSRRIAVWALATPLVAVGSQLAHALAYRIAYPQADVRLRALAASGHGYLAYLPLAVGVAAAAQLAGFAALALDAARGRRLRPLPRWGFALLPPLAFALQELAERALAGDGLAWWVVRLPTFRIGLALELPVALLVYLLARALLGAAGAVGGVLATPPAASAPVLLQGGAPRRRGVLAPRRALLRLGSCQRAPPAGRLA